MADRSAAEAGMQNTQNSSNLQSLKELGNRKHADKEYGKAAEIYSIIIDTQHRSPESVPDDLARAALANRAVCYLELGQHMKAVEDCLEILTIFPPTTPAHDRIIKKVHYRLSLGYYHLGQYEDAIFHASTFHKMNGRPAERETAFCELIQQARARANQNQPQVPHATAAATDSQRPFQYQVKIGSHPDIVFNDVAPRGLFVPGPPEVPAKAFLAKLVKKHHDEIMAMRTWTCWNCPKDAISILHTPASWLHTANPMIVDFALPICENRGLCNSKGRRFIQEEMQLSQKRRGLFPSNV